MKALARLAVCSCLSLAILPAARAAEEAAAAPDAAPKKEEKGEKKKKDKDKDGKKKDGEKKDKHKDGEKYKDGEKKDKHKDGKKKDKDGKKHKDKHKGEPHEFVTAESGVAAGAGVEPVMTTTDAKGAIVESEAPKHSNEGDWCSWLQDHPGRLYHNEENPWFQSFEIGGRFHYQAVHVEGEDVNGLEFNDNYDEFRRLRLETKTEFLKYFKAEINVNLVADDRFRNDLFTDLEWGYDRFDEASLQFDIGKAFGTGPLDGIKLKYGRMKLKMSQEQHMSSDDTYTIERSAIAEKLGGSQSRPTGVTLELDKGDFEFTLGLFSAEDDADFIGGWNDGQFFYGSLEWKPDKDFTMYLDYAQNNLDEDFVYPTDDALGYGWAASLSAVYEKKRWGVMAEAIYGDNGGANLLITRRAGDFHSFVVMPWVWIIEDKLQAVVQLEYWSAPESQGLQLPVRYIRADHENPAVDVDNGRGNEHHYVYAGLNYHFCKDVLKVMGGVSYDELSTRNSDLSAVTYQIAFRSAF
ncbi:porin [Haloferula sp. BvORR071]|uniref:porin n=1 Tax=Haloferula sp. BvORR071 TaxID=1396141 RepID=UPI002240ECDF|nr:porin [Haloferula sp. BvORR071]